MSLLIALLAIAQPLPVGAELVEALRLTLVGKGSPSTSSGRTGQGWKPEARRGESGQSGKEVARAGASALDAERAFAAMAREKGQWTAFRHFAADNAIMFAPGPVKVQEFLKGRKDPPRSVDRWPTASYVSCDGGTAVNTGGWREPDGSVGYFTTVWRRAPDGRWRWIMDGGDTSKRARSRLAAARVVRASCAPITSPYNPPIGGRAGSGKSADNSIVWEWAFNATGHTRVFTVSVWNGKEFGDGFEDLIAVK